jgi:vancomycin resistance protein VanJ
VSDRAHFGEQPGDPSAGQQFAGKEIVPPKASKWRRLIRIALALSCFAYCAALIAIWSFVRIDGDRWWPATMILFGPRFILLLPMIALVPLAIVVYRRLLWFLLIMAIAIVGPFMDLRITRRGLFPADRQSETVRILTLNTHFDFTNAKKLKELIGQTKPDIVALQEWEPINRQIIFSDPYWHTIQTPEALLASPYPIRLAGLPMGEADVTEGVTYRYAVELPSRTVYMYSVHLSSPHNAFRNVLHHERYAVARLTFNSVARRREATSLRNESDDDTILVGDFNLPRDSTIFRSEFSAFSDAFTEAGLGYGLTYFSRWTAVRIDHIIMGKNWQCQHCWVAPDIGSPHRPVIADLTRSQP